uniref:Protein kinase domain-containing protein n=1 Tax=Setaria italica TaxID=4555 RepID=K4AK32_SETIT
MKAATNKFRLSLRVDQGAFGPVFSGKIAGGKTKVAIKRRDPYSMHIGYCDEMGEMILVYNYMAHGCLRDHLYRTKQPPLTWNRRLEICIGAARGLHSLHTSQIIHEVSRVIYRNLKTTNILLDEEWVAKLTDLALCKTGPPTDVMPRVMGSGGLLDPDRSAN